jgi:hypothetical protein
MVSSSGVGRASAREEGDTGSDKSILDHPTSFGSGNENGVLRTKVFEVTYESRAGGEDRDPVHDRRAGL